MIAWDIAMSTAKNSVGFFFRHFVYYLKVVLVMGILTAVGGGAFYLLSLPFGELSLLVLIPGGLVVFLWLILCGIAMIIIWRHIMEYNQYITISGALSKAMESFLSYIGLCLITAVAFIMYGAILWLGMYLLEDAIFLFLTFTFVWIVLGVYFFTRLTLAPIILVLETESPIDALSESWKYTNGCVLQLCIGMTIAGLPSIIFSVVAQNIQPIPSIICEGVSGFLSCITTIFLIDYYLLIRQSEEELESFFAPTQPPAVG
ncbi:MAG TPA: hypothetical protein PKW95_09390 [bacterium]|nr:hypothetical protein [bacterium]